MQFRLYQTLLHSLALLLLVKFPAPLLAQTGQDQLVLTARGLGTSSDAAKKDALMNAVHQAVGSFVDSETLVRNDTLIKEELLQVSDGFVDSYEVLSGPRRRDDGLFEMAIKAVVKKGKVLARLQEVRVMSSSIAGRDVVAEVITKVENAQQGAALLDKHLNGALQKLLVARLLDANGKPSRNIRPKTKILADGRIECTWNIEVYFDLKSYYEQFAPQLDKVLTAAAINAGGPIVSIGERSGEVAATGYPTVLHTAWRGEAPPATTKDDDFERIFVSIGRDKFGDNERFRWYLLQGNDYKTTLAELARQAFRVKLDIFFLTAQADVIRQDEARFGEIVGGGYKLKGNSNRGYAYPSFLAQEQVLNKSLIVSPRFVFGDDSREYNSSFDTNRAYYNTFGVCDTIVIPFICTLEQEDLERLVSVRFRFSE